MSLARDYYQAKGWTVVERGKPYDLLCTNQSETLFVEVKGTTGGPARVSLTRNEVAHMRREHPRTALFLAFGVQLARNANPITCSGGELRELCPWEIRDADLIPSQFDYQVPDGDDAQ